jgi:short-subunit dehydrogenase
MTEKRVAIITGASAGLGAEYVRAATRHFTLDEIWCVARRKEPMEKLEVQGAKLIPLALDLSRREGIAAIAAKLKAENPLLVLLINNAGYGKIGDFARLDLEEQLGEIDLNVRALTELSHIALPYMKKNSYLMQIASSIGFAPAPRLAVYAATKAYVVSLSYALRSELAPLGIGVTAVCPGPVATEFLDVALAHDPNAPRSLSQTQAAAKASDVVEQSYIDMKAGKAISVHGLIIRIFVFLASCLPPSWMTWIVARRP